MFAFHLIMEGKIMKANDVLKLVNRYNAHEEEIFDAIVDRIIMRGMEELNKKFTNGDWANMVAADRFAICIEEIDECIFQMKVSIDWILYEDISNLVDEEILIPLDLFSGSCWHYVVGFEEGKIKAITPLIKALQRKGFNCYVDCDCEDIRIAAFVELK